MVHTIENEIIERLDGEQRETALGFMDYLNANGMAPKLWFGPGYWIVPGDGYNLFGICIYEKNPGADKQGWVLWFFNGDYDGAADEDLKEFIRSKTGLCVDCYGECESKGVSMTVFGNEYENLCYQFPVRINNPDGAEIGMVKRLIEYWKTVAPYSDGLHVK